MNHFSLLAAAPEVLIALEHFKVLSRFCTSFRAAPSSRTRYYKSPRTMSKRTLLRRSWARALLDSFGCWYVVLYCTVCMNSCLNVGRPRLERSTASRSGARFSSEDTALRVLLRTVLYCILYAGRAMSSLMSSERVPKSLLRKALGPLSLI